jgi:endoglucanase
MERGGSGYSEPRVRLESLNANRSRPTCWPLHEMPVATRRQPGDDCQLRAKNLPRLIDQVPRPLQQVRARRMIGAAGSGRRSLASRKSGRGGLIPTDRPLGSCSMRRRLSMRNSRSIAVITFFITALFALPAAAGPDLVDVLPLTDRIIMLHFDEGRVVHHRRGMARSDERVVASPLDTAAASRPETYRVRSGDDPAYSTPKRPLTVGRKSKGTDFAWFVDRWENGHAVNSRPDHAQEHWLYLALPAPLRAGKTYTVTTGGLAASGREWIIHFNPARTRSEAVHVNLLGYAPAAPRKSGYVYHWMGDRGSLDLRSYADRTFRLIDQATGRPALTGKLAYRSPANQPETAHKGDSPPDGNFLKADVYECDFSRFATPGRYRLAVEGVGASFPFRIDADVYREAFRTVARALYHNRSGIALQAPYTEFTRPAPHNPKLTPGFAGKLVYTTLRYTEWGSEGGNAKELLAHVKGPIESAGWYQDAGDWDSYETHLRVAQELLIAYELAPSNFHDGELNIPESQNGVPDILDEAAWLPRFCHRLRHELLKKGYGTGGVGLRIAGDAFGDDEKTLPDGRKVGQGSWEDVNRTWVASGEDPWSMYRYAGAAAHLAHCLHLAGAADPGGVDWPAEARQAYEWARSHTRPGDDRPPHPLKAKRAYAAAALFRLTGDRAYESQFESDAAVPDLVGTLWEDGQYGPEVYALSGGKSRPNPALLKRVRDAIFVAADMINDSAEKRALRWGGNWYMPMLVGQQTTPLVLQLAVAQALARPADKKRAERYLATLYTTCDYFLGTNALNMTWATGLGPRHPVHVFHMDAWYNGKDRCHPGVIPYGPWRKERDIGQGPWDVAWPHKTVYPPIDEWPGNERWFDNRCSPMNSEFTIHQNLAPAAAIFGILCAPAPDKPDRK